MQASPDTHLGLLCSSVVAVPGTKHELDPATDSLARQVYCRFWQCIPAPVHLKHLCKAVCYHNHVHRIWNPC